MTDDRTKTRIDWVRDVLELRSPRNVFVYNEESIIEKHNTFNDPRRFPFVCIEETLHERKEQNMNRKSNNSTVALIAVVVLISLVALGILPPGFSCFATVPAGYTGILTTFGKVEDTNLAAGRHWKAPWQQVVLLDNHVQLIHVSSGVDHATTKDTAETKDQQLIPAFDFEIQYQLNASRAFEVYSNYGKDYEDFLITSKVLQIIKETFAQFNADEIVINKAVIPQTICDKLNENTQPMGINIINVSMVTYDFSPEYTAILEERALLNAQLQNNELQQKNATIAAQTEYDVAVKQAEKEAETLRIESENQNAINLAKAEAQAEVERINAENEAYVIRTRNEAERDARLALAEAEKAELEAKASGLNDLTIQQEFIEKWDGKLVPSFGDTGVGFTNYTEIIKSFLNETGAE